MATGENAPFRTPPRRASTRRTGRGPSRYKDPAILTQPPTRHQTTQPKPPAAPSKSQAANNTYEYAERVQNDTVKISAAAVVSGRTYGYNPDSTIASATTGTGAATYAHDGLDRLTQAGTVTYTYDSLDRVTTRTVASVATTFSYAGTVDVQVIHRGWGVLFK